MIIALLILIKDLRGNGYYRDSHSNID